MKIGFCGTGRMGAAMVLRLIDVGHELAVWNRTEAKLAPLVARGARAAATPAEAAAGADLVITMLTDAMAIEAVYHGLEGLLSDGGLGRLFVDMSTVRPEVVRTLAQRVRDAGGAFVECPVGGTVGPARDGKLLGFAGGLTADVERARPVLEQLCRRVAHVGPNGTGASMKLAINLPLAIYWEALGEALSLCAKAGIEPQLMLDLFTESSGGANALKNRAPKVLAAIQGEKPDVGFDIDGMRKDLKSMADEAKALGVPVPLTERALDSYAEAAGAGWGGQDASSLAAWRFAEARRKAGL